ncbi:DUF5348 domain-containing protein [Lysinibacillus sphaericus]|uniref:DUF5348 domain-containing protein n=1 Tax=Lysinibacillus sphaericus TaxID=1421 RepID=UPI0025A033FF|nr:DUF5348 domain-containing protein [Lysinibacillus sphaericus]MDM5351940.1 DUF5348 domain-containing protein [Lysinibacillus sphaericus]
MSKNYFFEGKLTKDLNNKGRYYIAGNPLQGGQTIEVKIKNEWKECTVNYLEGEYFISALGFMVTYGVARVDLRKYQLDWTIKDYPSPNYEKLVKYLKNNKMRLENNEFKAVLLALNLITLYNLSKKLTVKYVSIKNEVTQKFLQDLISKMAVVSKQEVETRKEQAKIIQYEKNSLKWI